MARLFLRAASVAAVALALSGGTAAAAGRCGDVAQRPWCNTSLSPDARAGSLLGALTNDEKISLLGGDDLFGVSGGAHTHTGTSTGVDRVGLPTVYFSDGPVGPRQGPATAMPTPMGLAATFDRTLAFHYGEVVANEVRSKGNDVVFAPTVNIMRTPLNGRTFEAFGEDPFLDAQTTIRWIQGAQSQGVIANVKHYAANNQEGQDPTGRTGMPGSVLGAGLVGLRYLSNSVMDERTLREIYLPHFEAAIKQGKAGSVMCSYNLLNGQYACENTHLLQDILEREWGFNGFVLADYGAAHNTIASLNNGLDFDPWPGFAYSPGAVSAAVASGASSQATVDEHVRRILRTLFAFGFFDRAAYVDDDAQIDKQANARTAQKVEESAITLLENRGALPLNASKLKSIAIVGSEADKFKTGGGSGNVRPFFFATPRQAITSRAGPNVKVNVDDGSDAARAAAVAKASDVAIVFAGDYETEGADRQCLTLECPNYNGDQDALIEQVAAANPNTIVVLETGGPVLTPWRNRVKALVEAWYPGEQAGPAIARVLFGDVDPGGRLPVTFPRQEADLPTAGDPEAYPGVGQDVRYKEGVLVGYRWFDAKGLQPAFPFGFGRSYTSFAYRDLRIRPAAGGALGGTVSIDLVNTGGRTGFEVPQLYLGLPQPGAGLVQPPKQLKGYEKVSLGPGKSRRVTFPLDARSVSYWDVGSNGWKAVRGCYEVMVGRSSRDVLQHGSLSVGGASCPQIEESVGPFGLRLSLTLSYRSGRSRNGRRCAAGDVTARVGGRDRGLLRYADFSLGRSGLGRDRSAPFSKRVQRGSLSAGRIYRVTARAKLRGGRVVTLSRTFRVCGG
jgi:beta-glucosidase